MSYKTPKRHSLTQEEREAFLVLLLPIRHRLTHFTRSLTGSFEDARDLVNDTILAALEGFGRLKHKEAFLSYLYSIAYRLYKRRAARSSVFQKIDEEVIANIPTTDKSPDTSIEVRLLYEALQKLPERQRESIILFEISGLSLKEIQQIQGGTLSGVKMRLNRGREQLRKILVEHESVTVSHLSVIDAAQHLPGNVLDTDTRNTVNPTENTSPSDQKGDRDA